MVNANQWKRMTVFYRKYQFAIALRMDYVISMKRYVNANFIDNMKSENLQKKFYNLYKKNQNMWKGSFISLKYP